MLNPRHSAPPSQGTELWVMLPLDTVSVINTLNHVKARLLLAHTLCLSRYKGAHTLSWQQPRAS